MITFLDERSKYKKSRVSAKTSRENIRRLLEAGVSKTSITGYGKRLNPKEARKIYGSFISSRPTPTPATAPTTSATPAGATGINKAYEEAKKTYLDFLPSLRPRYDDLRKQLAESQAITLEKEAGIAGEEHAQLKRGIAKKGLEVSSEDQFYMGERTKLSKSHTLTERETRLGFAGKKLEVETAESQDIRDIRSMVAGLSVDQAKAIRSVVEYDKEFEYRLSRDKVTDAQWKKSFSYQKKLDKKSESQWKKTFAYTKDSDTADRALAYARLAKSSAGGGSDKYTTDLSSLVGEVYSGALGKESGLREVVAKTLFSKYPDNESQIQRDIYEKFFPEGFESDIREEAESQVSPAIQKIMDALSVDEEIARNMYLSESQYEDE